MDKRGGQVRLALVALGGLFPIGERLYPLPWRALVYDADRQGHILAVEKGALRKAPSFIPGQEPKFDHSYEELVERHYSRHSDKEGS